MYTHREARDEARRLRDRIDALQDRIEALEEGEDRDENYALACRLGDEQDRLERELAALSAADADPAAHGFNWAGDLYA